MKKVAVIIVLLAAVSSVGFYLITSPQKTIDEDYIKSEKYQSLSNKIESEKDRIRDEKSLFPIIAEEMLANQNSYSPTLPFRFKPASVASLPGSLHKIIFNEYRFEDSKFKNHKFYGLLASDSKSYSAVIFLMEAPGVYKNIRMILVTVDDSSVLDVATIGQYEKNITEKVNTELNIDKNLNIKTSMDKIRFYPVRQSNTVNYRYAISKVGAIEVTVL